ncbi:MAG: hypothetical protein K0S31_44 [Sphingobacterium multivorum]|jgi:hypothetical protein|nr:hypothetical protein [Sphingobacterium multivorum]
MHVRLTKHFGYVCRFWVLKLELFCDYPLKNIPIQ